MPRFFRSIFLASFMGLMLFGVPAISHADGTVVTLYNPLQKTISSDKPVQSIAEIIINTLFGIAGSVALAMFVWGGFLWLVAAGSSKRVEQGKQIFIWASLGILVMFSSYVILNYVFTTLTVSTGGSANTTAPSSTGFAGSYPMTPAPGFGDPTAVCAAIGGKCTGGPGTCSTGAVLTGICPTGNTANCCMQVIDSTKTEKCEKLGGICQKNSTPCNAGYASGLCTGGTSIQCCFSAA